MGGLKRNKYCYLHPLIHACLFILGVAQCPNPRDGIKVLFCDDNGNGMLYTPSMASFVGPFIRKRGPPTLDQTWKGDFLIINAYRSQSANGTASHSTRMRGSFHTFSLHLILSLLLNFSYCDFVAYGHLSTLECSCRIAVCKQALTSGYHILILG